MDFDKCVIVNELFLHIRRRDWFNATRTLLRYYASYGDSVVYDPKGFHSILERHLPISRSTRFRVLSDLEELLCFHKIDEFSCQMQFGLSIKGDVSPYVKYKGAPFVLKDEERSMKTELNHHRAESWEARGKNKKKKRTTIRRDSQMKEIMNELKAMRQEINQGFKTTQALIMTVQEFFGITDPRVIAEFVRKFEVIQGGLKEG